MFGERNLNLMIIRSILLAEPLLLSTSYDPETTILTLDVGKALEKNVEYKINILYNGVNRDTGQGFYRTTYDIDSGSGPR